MKRPTKSDASLQGRLNGVDDDMPTLDGAPEDAVYTENLGLSDGAALTWYLKEIRGISPLAHAQEIELATAREEGESVVLDHLLSTRLALDHVLCLGEKVLLGELGIRAVVEGPDDQRSEDCEDHAENDSVRDEFLGELKRLRRIAADLATLSGEATTVSLDKKATSKKN